MNVSDMISARGGTPDSHALTHSDAFRRGAPRQPEPDAHAVILSPEVINFVIEMRYKPDMTAGALKLTESRIVADLLLRKVDAQGWKDAIVTQNVLKARSLGAARRITCLLRKRLETMRPELWELIRDGNGTVAAHAAFAAAVKHSPLLGDFLQCVVGERRRLFGHELTHKMFADYLEECRERDPEMSEWSETTTLRLRSSVFQSLAQAGYIENTRTLKLQPVQIADQVLRYLNSNQETYVLRCMQVAP
jgi:hypothetical protein